MKINKTVSSWLSHIVQSTGSFFNLFVSYALTITGILFYLHLYAKGEVRINFLSTDEFLTSPLFSSILLLSSIFALLTIAYRILTFESVVVGTNMPIRTSSMLDETKRFSINESVNFLRTMGKFGFPTIINPSLWDYQNEEKRTICLLQASLYLREVNLEQFTEEDFTKFVRFISPYSCEDTVEIDKNTLEIFNDALPLMEELKCEIQRMTLRITYTSTTLSPDTLFDKIPSICRTILSQKRLIEDVDLEQPIKDQELSEYIRKIDGHSVVLMRDVNRLLANISFPPSYDGWYEHEIKAFKDIATSESKSVREYYQQKEEGKK